jgi:NTE family protein
LEALRGAGAVLRNEQGESFMIKYDERKELAPRDIVSRAITSEIALQSKPYVYLDATQIETNILVKNRLIEHMSIPIGIVATDLKTGEPILFRRGDTGQAVRASSSVPGIFAPTSISGRDYVDGGLSSPIPIRFAKQMGADIIIAVNISSEPAEQIFSGTLGVLLQTTTIMGKSISFFELPMADVVVTPQLANMKGTDFKSRNAAILAGEVAMQSQINTLKNIIANFGNP